MSRPLLWVVFLLPAIYGCDRNSEGARAAAPAAAPPTVSVIVVTPEPVAVSSEWVTTLDGSVNAQIRPQVSGYLVRTLYRDGSFVRKGQVLFEIDPRPFQAAMAESQAALAKAHAELGRTERDVQRDTPLAKERAIPQSQLDNDVQANLVAQATVKSAEAAVSTAQLNIEFTKVRSLIDGIAAIATAQMGDLVGPASLLTTVSQVDPIRAYFSLSEQEYLAVADKINQPAAARGLWKGDGGLHLTLADGTIYESPGTFLAADRQIDPKTGTIRISAAFPNPRHILRPGQYGRVRAETRLVSGALVVPQRAVAELQGGAQVRLVGPDNKIKVVSVTLGNRVGNRWIVTGGVDAGARVVMDAPQLRDGTVVTTRPYTAEAAPPGPTPAAPSAPAAGAR